MASPRGRGAALRLALLLAAASVPGSGAQPACPAALVDSTAIDVSATLYYAVVPSDPPGSNNGLFCARLEVEHDGWVGVAISPEGEMEGSTGIVGVPAEGSVRKYDLYKHGVALAPDARQTLMDASIAQDENGLTVMEFTKYLVEDGDVSIAEGTNTFLHARGGAALGYHGGANRFAFELDVSTAAAAATTASPLAATPAAAAASATVAGPMGTTSAATAASAISAGTTAATTTVATSTTSSIGEEDDDEEDEDDDEKDDSEEDDDEDEDEDEFEWELEDTDEDEDEDEFEEEFEWELDDEDDDPTTEPTALPAADGLAAKPTLDSPAAAGAVTTAATASPVVTAVDPLTIAEGSVCYGINTLPYYRCGPLPTRDNPDLTELVLLHGAAFTKEDWKASGILDMLCDVNHEENEGMKLTITALDLPVAADGTELGSAFDALVSGNVLSGRPVAFVSPSASGKAMVSLAELAETGGTELTRMVHAWIPVAAGSVLAASDSTLRQYQTANVPILAIHGDQDDMGRRVTQRLEEVAGAKGVELRGRHPVYLDSPEEFVREVVQFLDEEVTEDKDEDNVTETGDTYGPALVPGYNYYGRGSCQDQRGKMYSYLQRTMTFPNAETCGKQECERFGNFQSYRGFEFSVAKRCTCLYDVDGVPAVPNNYEEPNYVSKMNSGNGPVAAVSGTSGTYCYQWGNMTLSPTPSPMARPTANEPATVNPTDEPTLLPASTETSASAKSMTFGAILTAVAGIVALW